MGGAWEWNGYRISDKVEWSASKFKNEEDIHKAKVREIFPSHIILETLQPNRYRVTIRKEQLQTIRKEGTE